MKHNIARQRVDPVLAPDKFSVARPLRPENLDRHVTQHDIYPSLPAPNGVPWSEYIRSQGKRSRSVSSSTEALDSDHARYITCRIAQHARSMATGTRSLPTNSPVPYFQPIERGHMSEDRLSDLGSQQPTFTGGIHIPPRYVNPWEMTILPGGNEYHPNVLETDRVSTYTGLDDLDTLFEVRHGRGALDQAPRISEGLISSYMGITPTTSSAGFMVSPLDKVKPIIDIGHSNQKECVSMTTDMKPQVVSPSSEIIGEGAIIFTDMTETILDALDQQMAMSSDIQKLEGTPIGKDMTNKRQIGDNQMKETQGRTQTTPDSKEMYLDLFLPVAENHRISDQFCGYLDSLSTDNNPMVLVELKSLSYRYGTSIHAVHRVNGTMYGKFSVGYKIIPEKATADSIRG